MGITIFEKAKRHYYVEKHGEEIIKSYIQNYVSARMIIRGPENCCAIEGFTVSSRYFRTRTTMLTRVIKRSTLLKKEAEFNESRGLPL